MLHHDAALLVRRYLAVADRLLPGRITGFWVVGSAALGAWRPDRSDLDFVAMVDAAPAGRDVRRLRVLHMAGNLTPAGRAVVRGRPDVPGTLNGVFVPADEIGRPVTRIRPLASHTGWSFRAGRAFDVNPVMWKVLAERGITVRGPSPDTLGPDPEPDRLTAWNLANLDGYWRAWAEAALAGRNPGRWPVPARRVPESVLAAGALGPPRLHRTITAGDVVSKEAAGEYALDAFDARWHPLIRAALAHRRGGPRPAVPGLARRLRLTGEFVLEVIADAHLAAGSARP